MVFDLLQYICPPSGKQYRLFGLGDENCQCVQASDGWIEFRKNRHMEEFYATDAVIGRGADTSELSRDGVNPNGQFYVLYARRPDGSLTYGAPWVKRLMDVGEKYHRDCHVIRYNADGTMVAEFDDATDIVLNAHHPTLNFSQSGITVEDVIELQWGGEEVYYYGNGFGLIGWKNLRTGQSSFVGVLSGASFDPFPHDVKPRPRVPMPAAVVVTAVTVLVSSAATTLPEGTNPQQAQVNHKDGLWLLGAPGTSSQHIRVLAFKEVVTVFAEPVVPSGRYNWQRVKTGRGEEGWSAAVVDNILSFVPVESSTAAAAAAAAATVAESGVAESATGEAAAAAATVAESAEGLPEGTKPHRMQVNLTSGIWLLDNPGIKSGHIRVLPFREIVTVFSKPVVPSGDYNWQRVKTERGEQGWSAVVVGGVPTFVKVEKQVPTGFRLQYPVAVPAQIMQRFGVNQTGIPDFYTRFGLPAHEGIDFGGRLGDPIFAAAAGTVLAIAIPGEGGIPVDHAYGKHIKIQHNASGQIYETNYCHMSSIAPGLAVGQPITVGQRIGEMGNTGNVVDGVVHLHFNLRKKGATVAGEKQKLPDGTLVTYKNDLVDPGPYLG